ncbi:hypothetical protein G6L37_00150 [Agrobacterium rubi]|nr:hypothetical protein [Agrobacterium rubi]NTF23661.1 hypothetical protein [Agrobacterium rubi]
MKTKLKTIAEVIEYLQGKIEQRDGVLAEFDASRANDTLPHFMRNNAIDLSVVTIRASEAERFLAFAEMPARPDGSDYPDAEKLSDIVDEVTDFIVNRARSQFSGMGRSTCASTNLATDATKDFYVEFYTRLNHGH